VCSAIQKLKSFQNGERYSLGPERGLLTSLADRVTAALRADGVHAFNHYFPLNLLFDTIRPPESFAWRIVYR
jgi:hypothetical protein